MLLAGAVLLAVLLAGRSCRVMLASARLSCYVISPFVVWNAVRWLLCVRDKLCTTVVDCKQQVCSSDHPCSQITVHTCTLHISNMRDSHSIGCNN